MSKYTRILLSVCFGLTLATQAQEVPVKFGLESTEFYSETVETLRPRTVKSMKGTDPAKKPGSEAQKQLSGQFRVFSFDGQLANDQGLQTCFDHHFALWKKYQAEARPPETQEEFFKFKKSEDPFCDGLAHRLAPVLYFDFEAKDSEQHILESIDIETLRFDEYKGGGFVYQEAWEDIVLSPKLGSKSYVPDKRLVFTGTGSLKLRLWSGNFYPAEGWISPMGRYALRFKFTFGVKGKTVVYSTGPFLVDV